MGAGFVGGLIFVLAFAAVLIHLCVKSDKKIRTDYAATRK